MNTKQNTPSPRPDVADLLADQFPGHTMQRLRTVDGKYRYVYVSSGVVNSFGLDPAQLMQAEEVDHSWVHQDDRKRFVDELERSARELKPLDTEVRVEAPSGGYRWVRSLGQPRRQEDGSTIWDGVALDVTDRREALEALERTLAEARRSEVAEGRFAYIAAQDLSAPLNELRGTVSSLQSADVNSPEQILDLVSKLSVDFANYEKALLATKNLVAANDGKEVSHQADVRLTKRQSQILAQIREGASNHTIAETLGITEGTVKLHVSAILKALNVKNRTEAARLSVR
ncbi:MAG: LuxR C-terminal-related transcriptional regulator [Pseudomonadota bacterium]